MSGNLPKLVLDWQWKTTIAHKVGAVMGANFLEVRYEDLVCRPPLTIEANCAFIGAPYDPPLLSYAGQTKDVVHGTRLTCDRQSTRLHSSPYSTTRTQSYT